MVDLPTKVDKPPGDLTTNERVVDLYMERAIDLLRLESGTRDKVAVFLSELEDALVAAIAKIDPTGVGDIARQRKRLQTLLTEVRSTIRGTYRDISTLMAREIREIIDQEATWTGNAINASVGVQFSDAGLTRGILQTLVADVSFAGTPLKEWWSRQAGGTFQKFTDQMRQGMALGEPNAKLIERVRGTPTQPGLMNISERSATTLVRSSVQTAANTARQAMYAENSDIIASLMWHATLDTRTSIMCMARDGHHYSNDGDHKPKDDGPDWLEGPGALHPNCLPAGTLVTTRDRVNAATKRWYDGQLVVLRTASGKELSCTPNHPVLTGAGWIAAGFVNVGDNVVSDGVSASKVLLHDVDHKHIPAAIEEVAEAAFRSAEMVTGPVPVSAEDFHGDGMDGDIAIIATNRFLDDRLQATIQKQTGQETFVFGNVGLTNFTSQSGFDAMFFGLRFAADGIVSSGRKALSFFRSGARHSRELLLRSVARLDAMFAQNSVYHGSGYAVAVTNGNRTNAGLEHRDDLGAGQRVEDSVLGGDTSLFEDTLDHFVSYVELPSNRPYGQSAFVERKHLGKRNGSDATAQKDTTLFQNPSDGSVRDAQLARDILHGTTGPVFLDDVVSIERRDFRGHVYNLETETGFYVANGIITHNCRSTSVPILKTWRDLGIDEDEIPETTRASMDGQVPAGQSFEQWLKKQPQARQDAVLGVGKADLWRAGKIDFRDLLDQSGRPLTTEQLRAKASRK